MWLHDVSSRQPTFTWSVILKSPRISPVIIRACVLFDASKVPNGRIASPVYSLPSVEMNRTKRCALTRSGNNRSRSENHILRLAWASAFSLRQHYICRWWDSRCCPGNLHSRGSDAEPQSLRLWRHSLEQEIFTVDFKRSLLSPRRRAAHVMEGN